MKITFSNLGTIKKTELDLRALTVIIGPNNSSKTYVAYSIYGLWQTDPRTPKHWPGSQDGIVVDGVETLRGKINGYLKLKTDVFKGELDEFFQDSSHKLFTRTAFEMQLELDELSVITRNLVEGRYLNVDASIKNRKIEVSTGSSKLVTAVELGQALEAAIFPIPFLLPAERNAFVITYKILANRRYKMLKDAQRRLLSSAKNASAERQIALLREQGDLRYPRPIEDFLDFLTDIDVSEEFSVAPAEKGPFQALADDLEGKLQKNHKVHLKPTRLGGREIMVEFKKGLTADLYNASSSIKQLTPLLLYLRYRAKPNDFLIIDEPEMNLHPESQARLLEVLGILVNLGVRVLITTHSPYFMSHLNNLVAGDTARPNVLKEQAASLYLGDPRAFLPMDQVSAYEMRDNKLRSLKDEDYGIRWDTLSDVASDLQQKFFEISEKGSAGHGQK